MNKKNKTNLLESKSTIYLWIIAFLGVLIFYFEPLLGGLVYLLLGYLLIYNWRFNKRRNKRWKNYIKRVSSEIDSASRYAILNLPFPLVLINFDGEIKWYNSKFNDVIDKKELIGDNLKEYFSKIEVEELINEESSIEVKKNGRNYKVENNIVQLDEDNNGEPSYIIMLYWIDITDYKELKILYEDERPLVARLELDNYDEVIKEIDSNKKPILVSRIQEEINLWASRINGLVNRIDNNKYVVVFENKYLSNLEAKKFSLLDTIREISDEDSISPTLSIGVGTQGENYLQLDKEAEESLELALARGGDQAVVFKNDDYKFYGGKSKAVEKRNRVKSRVIAQAFKGIIDESKNIIIMGHTNPDMDSYGAAIGMYRGAVNRGKDAYILLNHVSEGISNIHRTFETKDEYNFITNEMIDEILTDETLLIIVDTHKANFTENPDLIENMNRIVMIDHHRRGKDYIKETLLTYQEPYASSTCELITEILQYLSEDVFLSKAEAEALLAGIYVDTKRFSFKTGVRTFEAASFLRRHGADTLEVKKLFKDDLVTYINRSGIVSNAKIYYDNIAISVFEKDLEQKYLIAAQGADELLNIRGIKASFVLGCANETDVFISGRSLGDISVQLILEKLGGGGHRTVAGAQFENTTIEEVKNNLLKVIEEYFSEEE